MKTSPAAETVLAETVLAQTVLAERRGPVLVLTLNRPERLNAWTYALEDRYFDLLDAAEADPEVRAVVVTGAGRGFCAGADLEDLEAAGNADAETLAKLPARSRPRTRPLELRKPLIAAVNGAAAGLGLVEALYCDLRFAAPDAKFTTAFARRGLIAEYGVAWLLPRLVGASRAMDLLLSGRVVRGEEALAMGLVDFVVEREGLLDAAVAYATELAEQCSPWSMHMIKQQVRRSLDGSFTASVAEADALMLEGFARPDVREGVASYLEHRAPAFPPLPAPRT
ncbi:enoyl-CoA hydratase-related protein [Streptacidiphilus anmyonensis]|uniref:enoyl-CoA hydratase-related protein n=1 Tax=Streptacidiphilus anmyonensis TaxID=405782 RepID=UPI0005AA3131|nr:enoyl-CoA hydratase-related protein [Streptacidiphilus anmyonensis]